MPRLDEMARLSVERHPVKHYPRMQALWFQIAYVIAPYNKVSAVRLCPSQRAHTRPALPRDRRFVPLRAEVRHVAQALRERPEHRWSLEDLAAEVHLSPSRLSTVFIEAYGKTPLAFLTMTRAENLAEYLRETDLAGTAAMQRGCRHSRSRATRLFREYVGVRQGYCGRMRRAFPT